MLRDDFGSAKQQIDALAAQLHDSHFSARLGIDPHPPSRERINESLSPIEMYWYPRLTRFVRRIPSRQIGVEVLQRSLDFGVLSFAPAEAGLGRA